MIDDNLLDLESLITGIPVEKLVAIAAKVDECMFIGNEHYNRAFVHPELKYDLEGRTAGQAGSRMNKPYIRLNTKLVNSDEYWDEMLHQTVPHEVAHVIQRQLYPHSTHHGSEWKEVMAVLGVPAHRTHSYKVQPKFTKSKKYEYQCECGPRLVTLTIHRRIQAGQIRYCSKCSRTVTLLDYVGEK